MIRTFDLLLTAAVTAFVTCDTGVVSLTTDGRAYAFPARITITLDNGTGSRVGYNLCFTFLERRTAGGWMGVAWLPGGVACAAGLIYLGAGRSASDVLELRPDLPAGEYRVVARVELDDGGEELVESAPFFIGAGAGAGAPRESLRAINRGYATRSAGRGPAT